MEKNIKIEKSIKRIRLVYEDGSEKEISKGGIYNFKSKDKDFHSTGELECGLTNLSREDFTKCMLLLLDGITNIAKAGGEEEEC